MPLAFRAAAGPLCVCLEARYIHGVSRCRTKQMQRPSGACRSGKVLVQRLCVPGCLAAVLNSLRRRCLPICMVEYRYSMHATTLSLSRARGHRATNGLSLMRELERRCGCTLSVVPCDAAQGLYIICSEHEHHVTYSVGFTTQRRAPRDHETAGSAGFHDKHFRTGYSRC